MREFGVLHLTSSKDLQVQSGDMVYYLYTDKYSKETKYPAVVLTTDADSTRIRIGRYDVHSKEITFMESAVNADLLVARNVPCSYEDELRGD